MDAAGDLIAAGRVSDIFREKVQAFCYIADRHSPRELIMSGEYKTHIAAILKAAERIEESTRGMTKATFAAR